MMTVVCNCIIVVYTLTSHWQSVRAMRRMPKLSYYVKKEIKPTGLFFLNLQVLLEFLVRLILIKTLKECYQK